MFKILFALMAMNPFIDEADAAALDNMRRRAIAVRGSGANVANFCGKSEVWWSRIINGRWVPNPTERASILAALESDRSIFPPSWTRAEYLADGSKVITELPGGHPPPPAHMTKNDHHRKDEKC